MTHPLIAVLVVPLSLLAWRVRRHARGGHGEQALGLLALLFLLRCILDPWNCVYYELPFLLALLAWESLYRAHRPPLLTLGATLATWVTFQTLEPLMGPDLLCVTYLAWALPLAAWLAGQTLLAGFKTPVRMGAPAQISSA